MNRILIIIACVLIGIGAITFMWMKGPSNIFSLSDSTFLINSTSTEATKREEPVTTNLYPDITFEPISLSPTLITGTLKAGLISKNISVPVVYKNGGYVATTILDLSAFKAIGLSKYNQANIQVNVTLK